MQLIPQVHRGFVLAVSAPSGTGKTSLCDKLAREFDYVDRSISVTTRPKRDGEISGKDYIFVSEDEFKAKAEAGELLETAKVFGNWYGTPRKPVEDSLAQGKVIVMDIDTVGALRIHAMLPQDSVLVFVLPPSFEELEKRLKARGKNSPEELERRLSEAAREVEESKGYHYIMTNLDFDRAYDELKAIVMVERMRSYRCRLPDGSKALKKP